MKNSAKTAHFFVLSFLTLNLRLFAGKEEKGKGQGDKQLFHGKPPVDIKR